MKKTPQNSREELINQTQKLLKSNGYENHYKAMYANEVSKEICGNPKPIFSQMQTSIKETKGNAWGQAYALVLSYLEKNNSVLTLECLQREIDRSKAHFQKIQPQISLENLQRLPKEDFQTRVKNFAKHLENKENQQKSDSLEEMEFYSSSTQPEKSDIKETEKPAQIKQGSEKPTQIETKSTEIEKGEDDNVFDDVDFEIGESSDDTIPKEDRNGSSGEDIQIDIDDEDVEDDNANKVNLIQNNNDKVDNSDDDGSFDISDDAFAVEPPKQTETIKDRIENNNTNQNSDSFNFEMDSGDPFNDSDSGF